MAFPSGDEPTTTLTRLSGPPRNRHADARGHHTIPHRLDDSQRHAWFRARGVGSITSPLGAIVLNRVQLSQETKWSIRTRV